MLQRADELRRTLASVIQPNLENKTAMTINKVVNIAKY